MQFRLISAFFIFIGSYLPLAIILAVQDIPKEWWQKPLCSISTIQDCYWVPFDHIKLSVTFILITTLSTIFSLIALRKITYQYTVKIITSKPIPNDIINYVFPYVVSFMGISYSQPDKLLGFLVFLLWLFAITYKSGQIIMNPLLLMFGWRLYEVTLEISGHTREVRMLKVGTLLPGDQKAQTIQDFYIAKG